MATLEKWCLLVGEDIFVTGLCADSLARHSLMPSKAAALLPLM